MKERGILFSAPMVRAILEGRKTQTRRIVKPQPHAGVRQSPFAPSGLEDGHGRALKCPYGKPGDRLWVRETWCLTPMDLRGRDLRVHYRADDSVSEPHRGEEVFGGPGSSLVHMTVGCDLADFDNGNWGIWRPSIHMPRIASRIALAITEVRVQRLREIEGDDARAEGATPIYEGSLGYATDDSASIEGFKLLWESINGTGSWDANPWVWALSFRVLPTNEEPTASGSAAQAALDSNAEHGQREALNPLPQDKEKS